MALEHAIVARLKADATVRQLSGGRIVPIIANHGTAKPFIAYSIGDSDDPGPSHSGPSSFSVTTFDVLTVADTYDAALQLSAEVRRTLGSYSGTNSGVRIVWSRWTGESDIEQEIAPGQARPAYIREQNYRAMHRSA